jgi:ribosomal-protein-alanine acetyltransferase
MMDLERASPTAAHWTEEHYRDFLRPDSGPPRLVLVAELESTFPGAVVGFLVAQHIASEWELENIVVSASDRRQGIGRSLLGALLAAARQTNSDAVFLEVRESNTAARSLYESVRFEQQGRRNSYYSNPSEGALLYRRKLP